MAREWINHVERERGGLRDREIYPRLRQWSSGFKQTTIVEIGAGQGICSRTISLRTNRYLGVEPSRLLVARARQRYGGKRRRFLVGSAYDLPIVSHTADAVFSVNVWFHLQDLNAAGREVKRILRDHGRFYIITASPAAYRVWEAFYFDYRKTGKVIEGKMHVPVNPLSRSIFYLHSLSEMMSSFEGNRLTVEDVETFGPAARLPANLLKKLGLAHEDRTRGLFVGIQGRADA